MALARYFRLVAIEPAGHGSLELSEIALYSDAVRVDSLATLSCSSAPTAGSLAALSDGDTATLCRFADSDVRASGFYLQWDFGVAKIISAVDFAASNNFGNFPVAATVLASADGVTWISVGSFAAAASPGAGGWSGYAPWIALNPDDLTSPGILSADRLTFTAPSSLDGYQGVRSIWGVSEGKWYFEAKLLAIPGSSSGGVGIATSTAPLGGTRNIYIGSSVQSVGYFNNDGALYYKNAKGGVGSAATYGLADTVGVALDCDARTVMFFKNGVKVWTLTGIPDGILYPAVSTIWDCSMRVNLGASPFANPPPSGYSRFTDSAMSLPLNSSSRRNIALSKIAAAHSAGMSSFSMWNDGALVARDVEFGGGGRIWGTNEIEVAANVRAPTGGRVVLLRQRDKSLVRETWADKSTGAWEFKGVDTQQEYLALAEDLDGNYRPVAANKLIAEVAP